MLSKPTSSEQPFIDSDTTTTPGLKEKRSILKKRWLVYVVSGILSAVVITLIGFFWIGNRTQSPEQTIWDQRIADGLKTKDCPNEPLPKIAQSSYQGPMIDTHFHPPSLPDSPIFEKEEFFEKGAQTLLGINITIGEIVCVFKADGTLPQGILTFWPVYPEIYEYALKVVKQTDEQYPGTFVPFINPPDGDNQPDGSPTVDAKKLDEMLSVYPGLFKGYGEIGLYARDGGAKALSPNSQRLKEIYTVLRKHNINRVFFHLGEGQRNAFDKVLRENRDITFIFHGDQLIKQLPDGTQDISAIEYLMKRNPNVVYGIDELWGDVFLLRKDGSKKEIKAHFKDYQPLLKKDVATWKAFIEKFPDRVMWDTDRGTYLWTMDPEIGQTLVSYVRAFIARLDPLVQEKYAYKNAQRILGD